MAYKKLKFPITKISRSPPVSINHSVGHVLEAYNIGHTLDISNVLAQVSLAVSKT